MKKENLIRQESDESVKSNTAFLDKLKQELPSFFTKDEEFDIEKFKRALQENNVDELKDGYQLRFIGKDYARRQVGERPHTVIVPDNVQNTGEGKNSKNLFFTGDNLEVLRHLQRNYTNKIDVIYIDPPYNTGGDGFAYPDKFEYSDEQLKEMFGMNDDEISRLKSIQGKSSHSAWLTFMYPRLALAKNLLSEKGSIFISIDENEDAVLKNLMNEIYGEINFQGQVIRKNRSSANDPANGFNQQHETLYIYSKNSDKFCLHGEEKDLDKYKNPDNDPLGPWISDNPSAKSGSDGTYFPIKNPYTNRIDYPPKGRYWAFSKETMDTWIKKGKMVFKKDYKESERGFFIKKYKNELKNLYKTVGSLFGTENIYMNQAATKYLRDTIFEGNEFFSSPKPVEFIKKLVQYSTDKNETILDFFAGSGTTADAVMRLNAEDGGNRKYIMVQLPEKTYITKNDGTEVPTKGGKNAYEAGFRSIDEISRARIKKAEKLVREEHGLTLPESFDGSFKHYSFVSPTRKLLEDIEEFDDNALFTDMLDSFSSDALGVNSSADGQDTVLTTWLVNDGYPFDVEVKNLVFGDYKAQLIDDNRLYLIDSGWKTENTKELVSLIGKNQLQVQSIVLFGYSFTSAELDELEIAIKQLNNTVNLITRY